ncbi:hypothetical protein Nepgr_018830 [Nepenthes gracilis]|uniref:Uncharacterized protein n=1 Tax=Nepenthes gracilis TaxID=150966 RepID=A0AAD3SU40_NEPGR|nr:hypothetical protein Nepgr_018830 [Nepenthes gracilis]
MFLFRSPTGLRSLIRSSYGGVLSFIRRAFLLECLLKDGVNALRIPEGESSFRKNSGFRPENLHSGVTTLMLDCLHWDGMHYIRSLTGMACFCLLKSRSAIWCGLLFLLIAATRSFFCSLLDGGFCCNIRSENELALSD